MRKVTFEINDWEYFKRILLEQGATEEDLTNIIPMLNQFVARYTITGRGKNPERYELVDEDGNKLNRNELNGYQRGVVLNDCLSYFMGTLKNDRNCPCGVIYITDEEVSE